MSQAPLTDSATEATIPDAEATIPDAKDEQPVVPPTDPTRSARTSAVTVWLAVLGIAATILGGNDTIEGSEIGVRVLGTLVLAAGLVLIAGAIRLRGGQPLDRALAMVAAFLGAALGGLLFLAQAVNDEPDNRLLAWAAVVLLSGASAWHIRALTAPDERGQGIWHLLPFLKSAVSIGVLISLGQFWYSSIYVPTTAPASLTLEAKLAKVGETASRVTLKGTVTIRNTSDTRVNVLGSSLDVVASRLSDDALGHARLRDSVAWADEFEQQAERYSQVDGESLLAHRRLVTEGFYFDPGEILTVPIIASVAKRGYGRARLAARLTLGRGKVLAVEGALPVTTPTHEGVVVVTRVPESGVLRKLTRGPRFVRTEYARNIAGALAVSDGEQVFVARVRARWTRREIYDEVKGGAKKARPVLDGLMKKLGVKTLDEVPDAYDRGFLRYMVSFVKDKRPRPRWACSRSCVAARFETDFDENLRRFYGVAHAEATDVVTLGNAD